MKASKRRLLGYERIYCFPNRFGFLGFGLFVVMIVAGATYQNNLVYMMAFLLLGMGLIAILQTARNIRNVEVSRIQIRSNFPDQMSEVEFVLKNPSSELKLNIELQIKVQKQIANVTVGDLQPGEYKTVKAKLKMPDQRGVYNNKSVRLRTTYPYLMFNAWKYSKVSTDAIVYPKPYGQDLKIQRSQQSDGDFSGHKKYESGDAISRMDWKIFARKGEYFVREFKDANQNVVVFTWDQTKGLDFENRLSQYAQWIQQAEKLNYSYDLSLNRFRSGVGSGEKHFQYCMEALGREKNAL